jgi:hypothetical protein
MGEVAVSPVAGRAAAPGGDAAAVCAGADVAPFMLENEDEQPASTGKQTITGSRKANRTPPPRSAAATVRQAPARLRNPCLPNPGVPMSLYSKRIMSTSRLRGPRG